MIRGFTLMELLVVLTILGLVLLLALPVLERNLPGLELRTEARSLASVLQEARARAIGRNEEVTIVIERQGGIVKADGRQVVQLNRRIAIAPHAGEALSAGDSEIRFFPDGTSTGGHLTLVLGERQRHVFVDWLTGAVSIPE